MTSCKAYNDNEQYSFKSIAEAARWLVDSKNLSVSYASAQKYIQRAIGSNSELYGYSWRVSEPEMPILGNEINDTKKGVKWNLETDYIHKTAENQSYVAELKRRAELAAEQYNLDIKEQIKNIVENIDPKALKFIELPILKQAVDLMPHIDMSDLSYPITVYSNNIRYGLNDLGELAVLFKTDIGKAEVKEMLNNKTIFGYRIDYNNEIGEQLKQWK